MLILPAPMLASRYFRRFQSRLAKVEGQVLYATFSWKQWDTILLFIENGKAHILDSYVMAQHVFRALLGKCKRADPSFRCRQNPLIVENTCQS